jgi:RNA polymerase sigma factor (sigma-70 family)
LYRVATNAGYNAVRERNRRDRRHLKLAPLAETADDPARQVMVDEERTVVRRALAELKPEQGQLLLLRQMGLSYRELGDACDVPVSSVGQLLARASRAFKFSYLRLTQERNHA